MPNKHKHMNANYICYSAGTLLTYSVKSSMHVNLFTCWTLQVMLLKILDLRYN